MAENKVKLPHDHTHGHANDILEHAPDTETIEAVSMAMKQLGDPSRLRIFWLLCHVEECVIDIAAAVNMTSPAVSHHLKLMKSTGLITSHRSGKEMYYKAADTEIVSELHYAIDKIAAITCPD